jgi:hypothetical protein
MVEWGVLTWIIDKLLPYAGRLYRGSSAKPAASWLPRLNERLRGEAEVFGPYQHEPEIHIDGAVVLTQAQADFAARERAKLGGQRPNDPHAILDREPHWSDDPLSLHVRTLDFASAMALRDPALNPDPRPQILSANLVLVCPETREVILHRRAEDSATYPSALHTFGGAYWPPGVEGRVGDRRRLSATALREVNEETEAALGVEDEPMIVLRELRTGFVQLAFVGVALSARKAQRLRPNREGSITRIAFDELPRVLLQEKNWVPTGQAALLAWLAMGAPNAGSKPTFAGMSPAAVFDRIVG